MADVEPIPNRPENVKIKQDPDSTIRSPPVEQHERPKVKAGSHVRTPEIEQSSTGTHKRLKEEDHKGNLRRDPATVIA